MTTTTANQDYDYDYLVIGGGSGGVSSAKRAAQLYGKRVAVVEGNRWGGTCVNVGCVPKKIMWQAATLREALKEEMGHYTFSVTSSDGGDGSTDFAVDWPKLKAQRDAYIVRLNGIYQNGLKNAGVTVLEGWGTLVDAHTVRIKMAADDDDDGTTATTTRTVTAAYILLATGGKPLVPGNVNDDDVITSDGFFELERQPKKAVVVGAGYIAVELAGVLAALGTEVHLVVRKESSLRTFDPELIQNLERVMEDHMLTMHRNTGGVSDISASKASDGTKTVTTVSGEVISGADVVLMAAGRQPNTDGLGLENVPAVQTDRGGHVVVDEYQNTAVESIVALGDLCGKVELTPMAIAAGRRLADRLFGPSDTHSKLRASYEYVPTVVFSHPPLGVIGLTEPQAAEKYGADNLRIYRSTFVNLHYSMYQVPPADKPKTFMKVICNTLDDERVVGMHMMGKAVDEILQGFGVAIKMGCTKADLDACVAIHPTAAEELVTLGTWGTAPGSGTAKL